MHGKKLQEQEGLFLLQKLPHLFNRGCRLFQNRK